MAARQPNEKCTSARSGLALLVSGLVVGLASPARAELRITEVLFNGTGSQDPDEWIELTNVGDTPVELSEYRLGDAEIAGETGEGFFAFPAAAVAPGESVLLVKSLTAFDAAFTVPAGTRRYQAQAGTETGPTIAVKDLVLGAGALALNNSSGDEVLLLRRIAPNVYTLVDGLSYHSTTATNPTAATTYTPPGGLPTTFISTPIATTAGELQSIARRSALLDTDTPDDWRVLAPPTPGTAPLYLCGNGAVETGETCDDGNFAGDDGCSAECQEECGFTCVGSGPLSCSENCGDGDVVGLEECDDGNDLPGDGCDATCHIETGFVCQDGAECDGLTTVSDCNLDPCTLPLRISEVHVDGLVDPGSEWIELTNAGPLTVDLAPWTFTDQATAGAAGEGALRFPDGAALEPGESVLLAYNGATFAAERGRPADFEYGVDSASTIPFVTRASDWAPHTTLALDNASDEVVLVCGGVVRDLVGWGVASTTTLAAPSPDYSAASPAAGPRTFERIAPTLDSGASSDWATSRCLSPGVAPNPNAPPVARAALVTTSPGAAVTFALPAVDPAGDALTFTLDTTGLLGSVELLAGGSVRYTPPAAGPLATSFRYTVADACSTTTPTRVDLVVTPSCDPGLADLRLTEVHVDAAVDNDGEWVELVNTSADPVDLGYLRLGDEELRGGAEGFVRFPPGTVLGPGEALVVAFSAAIFRDAWDLASDYEWFRNTDALVADLPHDPSEASGVIRLDNASDEVLLVGCDGAVIDALYWGSAAPGDRETPWFHRLPSPPAWDGQGATGPRTFSRRVATTDTDREVDWFTSLCPTPGTVASTGAAPVAVDGASPLAVSGTLQGRFSATDADSAALYFSASATRGTLTVLDSQAGTFTWTAPGGQTGLFEITFEVSDGCHLDAGVVQVCIGTTELVGNAVDEDCDGVALCFQDRDRDGQGSAITIADPARDGCSGPGEAATSGDCDDDPSACGAACRAGLDELCDGRDNDCVPATPDGADEPTFGQACDAASDADRCLDDVVTCAAGTLSCPNDPEGDEARVEVCDPADLDEDCDGTADDLEPTPPGNRVRYYPDLDGDGYGTGAGALLCNRPTGHATQGGDCSDGPTGCAGACNPGVLETRSAGTCADGLDNDCDGQTDTDSQCFEDQFCHLDLDGDGFGQASTRITLSGAAAAAGCAAWLDGTHPAGSWVVDGTDCDDDPGACGAACNPSLPDLCDGKDNDCSAATADGAGDVRVGVACDSPVDLDACPDETATCTGGLVTCPNDVGGDETRVELCDPQNVDEDCDGGADDLDPQGNALGRVTVYEDRDGDGRGLTSVTSQRCDLGAGYAAQGGDCDDDPAACGAACRPGLVEANGSANCADGHDNDCDGQTDTDSQCFGDLLCYLDRDRDGFGRFATETVVSGPAAAGGCAGYADGINPIGSWVGNGLDCDDDPSACGAACRPGASELCDGLDNDCSASTPDGIGDARVGSPCDAAADQDRCQDDRNTCAGGALTCVNAIANDLTQIEVCDGAQVDEDCDGGADDLDPDGAPSAAPVWFRDADADGYGTPDIFTRRCLRPEGHVANSLDCDDNLVGCGANCHPGETERCDGRDNDCDATTADGAADPAVSAACDATADANRCLDDLSVCTGGNILCIDNPSGDEERVEICDAADVDEDCDGAADDDDPQGSPGATTYYVDRDGDGAGNSKVTTEACDMPAGHVAEGGDCDDDPTRCGGRCHPGRSETLADGGCSDGFDNDCDGQTDTDPACDGGATCYADRDGDGFGDPQTFTQPPPAVLEEVGCAGWDDGTHLRGYWVSNDDDCNDGEKTINPNATELTGNDVDENCNGKLRCWIDQDDDDFARDDALEAEAPAGQTCAEALGLAGKRGDCDDEPMSCGAACNPIAPEICDELDNDCDLAIDEGTRCQTGPGILGGGTGCAGGAGTLGSLGMALALLAFVRRRRG